MQRISIKQLRRFLSLELKIDGQVQSLTDHRNRYDIPMPTLFRGILYTTLLSKNTFLSRDKLFDEMYLSADIFVLPTMKDHYGVVFLEAMSAGLPLVGTRSFTVPELIEDGKNGFLVDTKYSWENYPANRKKRAKRHEDQRRIHKDTVDQLVEKLSILIKNKKSCFDIINVLFQKFLNIVPIQLAFKR